MTEYVMVPSTPTVEMLDALQSGAQYAGYTVEGYAAMLSAAPNPWQPASTAPKNGTRIIGHFINIHENGAVYGEEVLTVVWSKYDEWLLEPDGGTEFSYDVPNTLIHWMHMPALPKKEAI